MPHRCAVRLLGRFAVEVDGRLVEAGAWRHRRSAELIKLLALSPNHRLHRDQVMERLWPELASDAAAANLRKAVHYARRALEHMDAITTEGDMLALWPSGVLEVDAERVESQTGQVLATRAGLEEALILFTGELLPEDRYAEWTEPARRRLQARRLDLLRAAGRWEDILELDRTDEEACRALMQAHLQRGNRQAAIRQFRLLREVLRVDLGVAPEPSTVQLFEEALALGGPLPSSAAERADALLANGLMQWNDGDLEAAEQSAREARVLALAEHLGRELGEASSLLGMVAMARGRWPEVFREEFTAAIRLQSHQEPFVLEAHLCLAEASLAGTSSEPIGILGRELLEEAIDACSRRGEAQMSMLIGEAELLAGRIDAADEWLSRAAGLYSNLGGGSGLAVAMLHMAEIALIRRRRAKAARQLESARRLAEESPLVSHLRPKILEGMIKASEGSERWRAVVGEAETSLSHPKEVCRPCSIGLAVAAAIACAHDAEIVRSRYWLGHAERLAGMWSGGPWQASVWEARAALRTAEGDRDQGVALLREAGNLFAQSGRPLDAHRCLAGVAAPV